MGEVVRLVPHQHNTGLAMCIECGHQWAAVVPSGCAYFECPECHTLKGVWYTPVLGAVDLRLWTCKCGSQFFTITEEYDVICAKCGTEHTF